MRRLIAALLHLYPRAFRDEFGAAIRDLADRELARAAPRGRLALLRATLSQAADIVLSAIAQRIAALFGRREIAAAWHAWRRDTAYGARLLAKHRAFSAVVIVTLALAIGANTVIFSFTNILLLRPLPLGDPEHVGWVFGIGPQAEGNRSRLSVADFLDYRAARSFTLLAARKRTTLTLSDRGDAERLSATQVTANLFAVWELKLVAGRGFEPGEDAPGAASVVVLSHQFWQRRFASDRSLIGHTLMLDGVSHLVVGVLDPAIEIGNLATVDVWTPLTLEPAGGARDDRQISVVGRLAPGVTPEQATAEIHAIATRLQREHPATNNGWDARVAPTREAITGPGAWTLLALLVLVTGFVLLIACANLANLMLARSTERAREVAVRTALGASRGAIVRQLIVESLLLGGVGGLAGLGLAYAGLFGIKAAAYDEIFAMLSIDRNVLAFVAVVTLVASVAFSLAPAIQTSRADVAELLKGGTAKASGGRRVRRGRSALVVSQVALALSLAVVAVLVVRSLVAMARIDVGFDTHNLFSFQVDVPAARYPDAGALPRLYERSLTELAGIPGVTSLGLANRVPVLGGESPGPVSVEGRVVAQPLDQPWAATSAVSAGFLGAARIAILAGRAFSAADDAGASRVAIVNREMAKRYWGSPAAAIGKRVAVGGAEPHEWLTIVGVSADTRPADITLPPSPQLYVPIVQRPARTMAFVIRLANAASMSQAVRAAMRRVDAGLAVYDARTMDEAFKADNSSNVVLTGLYVAFAAIALSLAAAGLYGVISYSVSRRTREIGIRIALGASAGQVRRLVLAEGGRLLVVGTVVGIAGGALIATAVRSLLYGVSPLDPTAYVVVIVLITAVMGLATYVPARRATSVDPNQALRTD